MRDALLPIVFSLNYSAMRLGYYRSGSQCPFDHYTWTSPYYFSSGYKCCSHHQVRHDRSFPLTRSLGMLRTFERGVYGETVET